MIKKIYHEKILREHPVRSCLDPIWNYTFVLMDFVSGLKYNIIGIHSFLIITYCSIFQQDKGGDPATFRETRAAFEVLRSLYQEGSVNDGSFGSYLGKDVEEDFPGQFHCVLYSC